MTQSLGSKIWDRVWSYYISVGDPNSSSWWKNICDVKEGVGMHEVGWFEANLVCHVGNGKSFSFRNDPWLEGGSLCVRFSCLFDFVC